MQTRDLLAASDIFRADYAYFSSHSTSWLDHASTYVDYMAARFELGANSRHVEIASNDGYLLQYSMAKGINCLGIEPCESVALAAREEEHRDPRRILRPRNMPTSCATRAGRRI